MQRGDESNIFPALVACSGKNC